MLLDVLYFVRFVFGLKMPSDGIFLLLFFLMPFYSFDKDVNDDTAGNGGTIP